MYIDFRSITLYLFSSVPVLNEIRMFSTVFIQTNQIYKLSFLLMILSYLNIVIVMNLDTIMGVDMSWKGAIHHVNVY